MKVTLVVPCYNEAARLPRDAFRAFAAENDVRFLFVDDGSSDETAKVIEEELRSKRIDLLRLPQNVGKGEAVRQGLVRAIADGADVVGFVDADLATPLGEVIDMLAHFEDPDLLGVTGARVQLQGTNIERRTFRHYAGRVFATAASGVLGRPYYDTQCGAKLFRAHPVVEKALSEPFSSPWIFDVELLGRIFLEADKRGMRKDVVLEHPLREWRDVGGSRVKPSSFLRAPIELARIALNLKKKRGS